MSSPFREVDVPVDDRLLTGWGRTMPSRARVVRVRDVDDVVAALTSPGPRGVLVRGAGRSYGDAAQNAGGTVLDLRALDGVEVLDDGDVVAGAGVLLAALVPLLLARGRFLPVTPGTRFVTVAGAVAADVHGKNHHRDGSFGDHVRWIDLVTADGRLRRTVPGDPDHDGDLADATIGGMGLTGAIVAVRFATIAAPSTAMSVDTLRYDDLDSLMAAMVESDATHRYSVAWVDGMARGARLGRGVLTRGDHADREAAHTAVPDPEGPRVAVPPLPFGVLTRTTLSAFNAAWFRRAPRRREAEPQAVARFFYPLDGIGGWNRLYGPRGFLQYQFAVPDRSVEVVRLALERFAGLRAPSFLSVLKRFGPARATSPLSFPLAGWTLALDLPVGAPGLAAALDELDGLVLAGGGRIYLAKDSRAVPATIAAGYAGLPRFRDMRDRVDPHRILVSDLSRRLDL